MSTVGAFNVTPTTVNTFDSGAAPELEQTRSSPTYTTATSADGMQQTWTPTGTRRPVSGLKLFRALIVLGFIAFYFLELRGDGNIRARIEQLVNPDATTTSSPDTTTPFGSAAPAAALPVVDMLPASTPLRPVTGLSSGSTSTVTLLRSNEITSVSFFATGPSSSESQPIRTLFLTASGNGLSPRMSASNPDGASDGIVSRELPLDGSVALEDGGRFEWSAVSYRGRRVLIAKVVRDGAVTTMHAGNAAGAGSNETGQSPLSYDQVGAVGAYIATLGDA